MSRHAIPRLDAALAPFRAEVAASGMTDDDLAEFFEAVRDGREGGAA